MKKSYQDAAEKKLANDSSFNEKKIPPQELARIALVEGTFATKEREEFFDKAYGEILVDYFEAWLKTDPHETKAREFLYDCAMALGDVKSRLMMKETYGKNVPHLEEDPNQQDNN